LIRRDFNSAVRMAGEFGVNCNYNGDPTPLQQAKGP
jgi:hypothetical protein